jgi:hypothetical protein
MDGLIKRDRRPLGKLPKGAFYTMMNVSGAFGKA